MRRKELIIKHNLIEAIGGTNDLDGNEKELLQYIVKSVVESKEHLNYLIIFASFILAIAVDVFLEFFYKV